MLEEEKDAIVKRAFEESLDREARQVKRARKTPKKRGKKSGDLSSTSIATLLGKASHFRAGTESCQTQHEEVVEHEAGPQELPRWSRGLEK